jgi:hypothetical protein
VRAFPPLAEEAPHMPSNDQPQVTIALECLECGERDGAAEGWRAYLEPEGDGLLIFCRDCAEREFGPAD